MDFKIRVDEEGKSFVKQVLVDHNQPTLWDN
ncbi:hypothetical protein AK89_00290 [Enterococcus mundtii CRL35]|nr:hypothetical protein AK89_00290 [Enterococcus mundtii CRL35]